jgi:hypothetical protein
MTLLYGVEEQMLLLLIAMIEATTNFDVIQRLKTTIKFDTWLYRLTLIRKMVHLLGGRDIQPARSKSLLMRRSFAIAKDNLNLGHKLIILVHYVGVHDSHWYMDMVRRTGTGRTIEYFDVGLRHIEVYWHNKVYPVFFPIPPMCHNCSKSEKESMLALIDRHNHDTKLTGFTQMSKVMYFLMRHADGLKKRRLDNLFSERKLRYVKNIKLILALIINLFVFLFLEASRIQGDVEHLRVIGTWLADTPIMNHEDTFVKVIGYMHLTAALYVMICRYVLSLPIIYSTSKKSILAMVFDPFVWYPLLYVTLCIIALSSEEKKYFVYCFCLLDIVDRSKSVRHVLLAVTRQAKVLALTICFLVVVLMIFGYTLFYFNRDKVMYDTCNDLFTCVMWTLYVVRFGGGFAEGITDYDINFEKSLWFRKSFTMGISFYLIVNVMLLNLVFGIIIDKFAELRQENDMKRHDQDNFCFICGLPRRTFELSQCTNFETHIKEVHNMWAYQQYFVYLGEKSPHAHSGMEKYVSRCIANNDIKWFPQGVASDLSNDDENSFLDEDDNVDKEPSLKEVFEAIKGMKERLRSIEEIQVATIPEFKA